jgi:hypothetical protein
MITVAYFFYDCSREVVESRTRSGKKFWDGDNEYYIHDRLRLEPSREQWSEDKGPWRVRLDLEPL